MPDTVEKEEGVSLWSLIKDNIGKELTRVYLPVYFNEPISSLQKCFEDLEYSWRILEETFIQLLRTKTIKNKIKNKYSEKKSWKKKKKEKSYLNVVASEANEREKIR